MQIVDVKTRSFRFRTKLTRDSEGHLHPGPEHDETQTILTIVTDEGVEGYGFGSTPKLVEHVIKPELLGEEPLYREKLWQRLKCCPRIHRQLNDCEIAVADLALWDLAGRCSSWTVERTIAWIQNFRRLCIRWERSTRLFQGYLYFSCALLLLKEVLG